MASYTELLRTLSVSAFAELLMMCSRQAREGFFARHQVRAPKAAKTTVHLKNKNTLRAHQLFEVLAHASDEPLCEELLRVFLLQHRAMLAKACDELKIPHEEGLSDSPELKRFGELTDEQAAHLVQTLVDSGVDGHAHAATYVEFMRQQMRQETR